MDEKRKQKIAQSQKERWARLKADKRAANTVSHNLSQAMREFWASKSKEERLLRAQRAAATRRKNQANKAKGGK